MWILSEFWHEIIWVHNAICHIFFCFVLFLFFRAVLAAYGSPQARGGIRAADLHQRHSNARSEPCLWPPPKLMAMLDPLTHWARPGIKSASPWILVGFLTPEPWQDYLCILEKKKKKKMYHTFVGVFCSQPLVCGLCGSGVASCRAPEGQSRGNLEHGAQQAWQLQQGKRLGAKGKETRNVINTCH